MTDARSPRDIAQAAITYIEVAQEQLKRAEDEGGSGHWFPAGVAMGMARQNNAEALALLGGINWSSEDALPNPATASPTDEVGRRHAPPFGGTDPCPMCPSEIRNLSATAHNLIVRWDSTPPDWPKIREKLEHLREAVEAVQPLVDAHFADSMHSHGRVD